MSGGRRPVRDQVPFHWGVLGHERRQLPYTRPEHVRLGLEELGATFVKLGQMLSTRGDLLEPAYQAELAQLQDAAPPEPVARVRAVIEAELGQSVARAFASFDDVPLAAASIGQAHAATLHDGRRVVVKVRRPGVVEQVELDLRLIDDLAVGATRRWEPAARHDLVELVRDPLERIDGIKLGDLSDLDSAGIDRPALARRAARVTLHMVFIDGFFHADPHPGNVFVEPDGRIALVDFGMVGSVDSATRRQLVAAPAAAAGHDTPSLVEAFTGLGLAGPGVDRAALGADLATVVARLDQPLGEVSIGSLLGDLVTVLRRSQLRLPPGSALLVKTIAMCEGVGAMLDPGFQLMEVLIAFSTSIATAGAAASQPDTPDAAPADEPGIQRT